MSRALVLSGGGPVGVAWQSGLITGLAEAGVTLADADLVVGTSAGSAVGAQLKLHGDLAEQLSRYRSAGPARGVSTGRAPGSTSATPSADRLAQLIEVMSAGDLTAEERRRAVGRYALEADTGPEEDYVATFRHLSGPAWPDGFVCTAVDVENGDFAVWAGQPGVALDRAVASSCAAPGFFPPVTIKGRRYTDGGARSLTNADVAAGSGRVLIVTLMSASRVAASQAWAERLRRTRETELEVISAAGGITEEIAPDDESAPALGTNLMDGSHLLEAAEAGLRQAKREADRIRDFWGA